MKNLVCRLRLHWLFDHGIAYNALFDAWRCKHCGHEVQFWPKPRKRKVRPSHEPRTGETG